MTQSELYLDRLLIDVEAWRARNNYTQAAMAEELGVTRSHLNKVLNKKTLPSLQLIYKMEEVVASNESGK